MEDPRWLRLLTVGLVLAALAVGYFLFTGKFAANSAPKKIAQSMPAVASSSPIPSQDSSPTPAPTPISAYNRIVARNQPVQGAATQTTKGGETVVLPRTGFPLDLAAILSISVMISGWGLRRFPK